jgi:phosphoribosylformylglycinamidine synthase PurS subunit
VVRLLARVIVTPKPVVNDPQGATVRAGLHRLGFEDVSEVRVGKYIEVTLEADDETDARHQVSEMCRKLLANHVIEDVRFQVERAEGNGHHGHLEHREANPTG